ncbi:phosphoadenosine phosphosulfate reductase family protein [Capnocytophaga canimorsus]|uniref:phosphoadenosine phosphosulfate reductase domain-containing protein n=1 Tax=Capnocytophaga canimorsus TaxID=28188 RepID=UPI0037CE6055
MLNQAQEIIEQLKQKTSKVVLFHSMSGKDSIALLNLLYPHFEVTCVFMYVVKDLQHINRYINYINSKYPKAKIIQVPHFGVYSYIKSGYLGCKQNPKQKQYNLSELTDIVRERTGIEWAVFGFKQSDSMNRRLMLRTYENEAINEKNKKAYPLSKYKNKDILHYIQQNNLITPESYGQSQSSGTSISDINYLLFLREKFPEDLKKIFAEYPLAERKLYEYDYENTKTK